MSVGAGLNDELWMCGWGLAVLPMLSEEHPRQGFLEKFWLQGCRFWGIFLAVMGIESYIIFTGNINFKMKITFVLTEYLPSE